MVLGKEGPWKAIWTVLYRTTACAESNDWGLTEATAVAEATATNFQDRRTREGELGSLASLDSGCESRGGGSTEAAAAAAAAAEGENIKDRRARNGERGHLARHHNVRAKSRCLFVDALRRQQIQTNASFSGPLGPCYYGRLLTVGVLTSQKKKSCLVRLPCQRDRSC